MGWLQRILSINRSGQEKLRIPQSVPQKEPNQHITEQVNPTYFASSPTQEDWYWNRLLTIKALLYEMKDSKRRGLIYTKTLNFARGGNSKSGLTSTCKECAKKRSRTYYAENTEYVKQREKKYYRDNIEKITEYHKRYTAEHKEELAEYKKAYYEEHRDEILEKSKQYYASHKKQFSEYGRRKRAENPGKKREQNRQYIQKHDKEKRERDRKYREINREAWNALSRAYYAAHREERQRYSRQYQQEHAAEINQRQKRYLQTERGMAVKKASAHNHRARKRNAEGVITKEQIQQKLKSQKFKCYYCFAKFEQQKGKYIFHLEHTIPVSRIDVRPRNDINFVVLACPRCNISKNDKCPWEWPEGGRLI